MTPAEFKEAQASLGFTIAQMAEALGMSIYSIREMRLGRRPVTARTALLIGYLRPRTNVECPEASSSPERDELCSIGSLESSST
jgi:transcriptional regulator with XRE-family HTH domain